MLHHAAHPFQLGRTTYRMFHLYRPLLAPPHPHLQKHQAGSDFFKGLLKEMEGCWMALWAADS